MSFIYLFYTLWRTQNLSYKYYHLIYYQFIISDSFIYLLKHFPPQNSVILYHDEYNPIYVKIKYFIILILIEDKLCYCQIYDDITQIN